MKDKIQELYDTVDRYKGFSFMPLWTLDKISKLTEELREESRKYMNENYEDRKYSVKTMTDYLSGYGWWRSGDNLGDESRTCELVYFDDDGGYAPTRSIGLPKNEGQTFGAVWDELEQSYSGYFPDDIRADFSKWMKSQAHDVGGLSI